MKLTAAQMNATIAAVLTSLAQCVKTGKDLNGQPMTAEALAKSLRTLADIAEGKTVEPGK